MPQLTLFSQGFLIVALTALNVRLISRGLWLGAFLTGFSISWVWWQNSQSANRSTVPGARATYAIGAACGTVCGMWLGGL
jgi:hypothetical protein